MTHTNQRTSTPMPSKATQPAEVTDERLLEIGREWTKEVGWYEFEVNDFLGCARAILALADFGANRNHPAQGVPDTLKDHQIAAMVNTLRDIARQFHGHDSLRERISNVLVPALKAEAQQPATTETVYQICKADSVSISTAWVDVQKQQYDDAALYPEYGRRVLYTHPAPGVTEDVVRDAERYRWLKAYDRNSEDMGICKWVDEGWSGQWVLEHDPDTSIDAAMLAASPAQKGQP